MEVLMTPEQLIAVSDKLCIIPENDPAHELDTFCPATMCPLIAPNGSPWTKQYNSHCHGESCGFFDKKRKACDGGLYALGQVEEVKLLGTLQLGTTPKFHKRKPMTYDCPREHECQWQRDSKVICPPRHAMAEGLDPRVCLF